MGCTFQGPARWLIVSLLLATACGGVDSRATFTPGDGGEALDEIRFLPGEYMEWEVRWLGVLVGRVQLAVGREGELEGRRALVVRSLAQSDGALAMVKRGTLELTTWIDLDANRPMAQAGSFDEIYTGEILGTRFGALEWPRSPWITSLPGGGTAQSSHTALGVLRGWRPLEGTRAHMHVRFRHLLVRLDLTASARERVASPLGRSEALRIDGLATPVRADLTPEPGARPYPISIWVDDEGRERVPVRIAIESHLGVLALELVVYEPPGSLG